MIVLMNGTSVGADAYSSKLDLRYSSAFAMQVEWTGTPTGVLKMQFSDREDPTDDAHWVTHATIAFPSDPAGSASLTREDFSAVGAKWARLWYDRTSGTGTMTVYATIKES